MNTAFPHPPHVSRPKVHRPPALPRPEQRHHPLLSVILNYGDAARVFFTLGSIALVLLLAGLLATRFFPASLKHEVVASANAETAVSPPAQKTIVLRNENDVIIGQMARISSPSMPPAEVSTMSSDVDKRKGQELLSIIGKY